MNSLNKHLDLGRPADRIVYEINKKNEELYGPYSEEMSMFQSFIRKELEIRSISGMSDGKTLAVEHGKCETIKFFIEGLGEDKKEVEMSRGGAHRLYISQEGTLHGSYPTNAENEITDTPTKARVAISIAKYTEGIMEIAKRISGKKI